ncbi:phage terminase small subunit [Dyella sp.]|uniref:phage terminase small subunit n=1 Tax=Dyella sp. TaxID=1869338 RepID=UPI002B480444|nr:phage terminase small subunit [Dyella sp.]HKT28791.1 phage terminase small subunit [Dyella sp.]
MGLSPAQAHLMRVEAKRATAQAAPGAAVDASTSRAHNLMRAKLDADRRRLHQVQSVERKIAIKREILPDYDDYVAGVLASGQGVQDDVIGYVLTWRIDIGDYSGALDVARYVLDHNLSLPDRFERTPATLVAEEPAVQALKAYDAGKPFDIDVLETILALTAMRDMPDQVRAKLHFAIGRHQAEQTPQRALDHLRRAVELNDKVGAKKDIEQLERRLRNSDSGPSAGNPSPRSRGP